MGYRNAADILPENLLEAIQAYIEGEVVYIPKQHRGRTGEKETAPRDITAEEIWKSEKASLPGYRWRNWRSGTGWHGGRSGILSMNRISEGRTACRMAGSSGVRETRRRFTAPLFFD